VTTFIAVSNRRGGVGKTTVTMMLAYGLSVARRQRVLVIDLDAQASTSIVLMGHERWRAARDVDQHDVRIEGAQASKVLHDC
jgi:cellulose biosynthesis protein BcsQ